MPITTPEQRDRLTEVIAWAATEDAKKRLGLPSEWNQRSWLAKRPTIKCGTACCIAGKIALDDGGQPVWNPYGEATYVRMPDRSLWSVEDYAKGVLGLTRFEADQLFNALNTLDSLVDVADRLLTPSGS